ncbi:MAG TPA: LamG-like jellyroll fold domain-containing protein [Flavobacteriales bacterium]|nr:LamG-like jellyroll fold domain-containing protein [Flavobacteriales bacterium]
MKLFLCCLFLISAHILNGQLLSDSLKAHYTFNGNLNDVSGMGNHILSGSGTYSIDRFGNLNAALELNGISDSLTFPVTEFAPITGDFTIGFWFKTNEPGIQNLFSSKQSPTDTTANFELQLSSHNQFYLDNYMQNYYQSFAYWNGTGQTSNAVGEGVAGQFTNGAWSHFVLLRHDDTFRIYINHIEHTMSLNSSYNGSLGDAVNMVFSASPYKFNGLIDDVRLYNRALNQQHIDLLWFENNPFFFTQPKHNQAYVQGSNLLVYWEYDTTQISDSVLVEYRLNNGSWTTAVHSGMAYESYLYVNMTFAPGTLVEVRVTDRADTTKRLSTGIFSVSEYDWVEVADSLPFNAKDGAGLLNFDNKMWLLGGWDPPFHPPLNTHNEVWNSTDGLNWNFVNNAPWPPRHCGAWISTNSLMWVIGGDPQSGCLTDVWKTNDGVNWLMTQDTIAGYAKRNNANYAWLNNKLLMFGGEICSGEPLAEVWESSDGINWTQLPDAPWKGRGMQINYVVDDSSTLWVLGGSNERDRRSYNDVWKTTDGVNWTLVNACAPWTGRYWHTTAWFDHKMWLMGGVATGLEMNDVWYSENGAEWHELKSTTGNWPAGTRHAQSTTVYDNALWYMCGISTNNAWKLINTTTVGMHENENHTLNQLQVFPNPGKDNITIRAEKPLTEITVTDIAGNRVAHYNLKSTVFTLGHNLQSGTYIISCADIDNNVFTGKFIVVK